MTKGYVGKICFVDLSSGEIKEEKLDENLARDFIGGHGLGARILFEWQEAGVDPIGPDNILGFVTGPLTGTAAPTGARYMAVSKSPLTGGWGDANAGGFFGTELKAAGLDALFVSGKAASPRYLLVTNGGIELKDAAHLWGRDTVDAEDMLGRELGFPKLRVACIGPASEKGSLISGIVSDKGRIAARSGLGAVMGSKRLKAVAVSGREKVAVADKDRLSELRKAFIKEFRASKKLPKTLRDYGTCGITAGLVASGATPVKNWLLAGDQTFPTVDKVVDADTWIQYQIKKYGCANCPIACGGIFKVDTGQYPVEEVHKPEYETIGAFGPMCLNDDLLSIIKMTDMCNRSGLDTISAGTAIAFAMECFEKGIITTADTDGIELTWGNANAMIAMLEKIIRREGFGDILADGVNIAAQKIGKGAEEYAIHVGGQEPGLHNALYLPSRGMGYVVDPTPGRHTAAPMARLDAAEATFGPYPEMQFRGFKTYEYKSKGPASATVSCYNQVGACAGLCNFPVIFFGNYPLIDFLDAATGWGIDMAEALETGARIQAMRQAFNIREGLKASEIRLPPRMIGLPPKTEGPLAGITIDVESLKSEYYKAMGWDPNTGVPTKETLKRLRLKNLIETYGK